MPELADLLLAPELLPVLIVLWVLGVYRPQRKGKT